jgi:DNA modification methylase
VSLAAATARGTKGNANRLLPEDRAVHDWYRFVLSFPPHLVRDYLVRFGVGAGQRVLDPFCGTGTVLVECKKLGLSSVGLEPNPMAHFASSVKLDWTPDPDGLIGHARRVGERALAELLAEGLEDTPRFAIQQNPRRPLKVLPEASQKLLLEDSISPLPLHKTLVLLEALRELADERYQGHELLALAKALTSAIGNLHFGPEVGVGPPRPDAAVVSSWLTCVRSTSDDLRVLGQLRSVPSEVLRADARQVDEVLEPASVSAVITSPPYPNEKDYTRTTRLESVVLGFIRDRDGLRALKQGLVCSNTRNVYKQDEDDQWVADHPEIQRLARAIEKRRVALGKTSGFERLYPRVTKLYFGGMARHLAGLRKVLRPGAHLAYVVGDQASYLRVMIRTGKLLADIGQSLGYELAGIDLFRTRRATATRADLREEVVVLRWPGGRSKAR